MAIHEDIRPVIVSDEIEITEAPAPTQMRVRKRDGSLEPVNLDKIVRAISRCAQGVDGSPELAALDGVDVMRVATRTISGLHDGATTEQLDELSIRTAASLISDEPNYSRLAARMLATVVDKEVQHHDVYSFSQSIALGQVQGLINETTAAMVSANSRKLNDAIAPERNWRYEFFGLRTVYDRYLLRHPETRKVIENPQYFLMRVACGLSVNPDEAIEFYRLISSLDYLPSSPTLFNSGTAHPQMSSCYLLDSPEDNLDSIYDRYRDVARLSKHAGGIGLSYSRVRSRGSLIRGTNGLSNGIVPWLKTLDASVAAVNQGGRRKGAACVYVETWHADIEEFLELRDNTGDLSRRTHNLNLANWIPDLFMQRVEKDWQWSLFDPKKVPHLVDLYGADFEQAYLEAESAGLYERQVPARQIYQRMMRTLAETGNGWMTFKDASNLKANQTGRPGNVVHLSNLCTEILEVTNQDETAVCNLGSVNLGAFIVDGAVDYERLGQVVRLAVRYLDRVVDINFYPTDEAGVSNAKWRPVGLGLMGLQDVFFKLKLPFDAPEAREISTRISEEIYFNALWASSELAEASGAHAGFAETRAAKGELQFDLRVHRAAGVQPVQAGDAVGRVPADQHLPGARPTGPRAVERVGDRRHQAGRGVGRGDRGDSRRPAGDLPHRVGVADALARRHGRRPWRLRRSEPVAQPVRGVADDREAVVDVPLRLEAGAQDHLLPAFPPGDAHQQDHHVRRRSDADPVGPLGSHRRRVAAQVLHRGGGARLLAREPRVLRGLPVAAGAHLGFDLTHPSPQPGDPRGACIPHP